MPPTRPPIKINPWDSLIVVESIFCLIISLIILLGVVFCIWFYLSDESDPENDREPLLNGTNGTEEMTETKTETETENESESERTASTVDEERGSKTGFWGACEARVRYYENIR
jgi:hypothetical protein